MKWLLAALLVVGISLSAQTWVPSLSVPPTSFNNVQIYNVTHPDTAYNIFLYGVKYVLSATTAGGTVTYTTNRGLNSPHVGDTICVTIGPAGAGCTSTSILLTPGNPIASNLLGSCTITAFTSTPTTTYQCSTSSTSNWTFTQPYVDQNASTVPSGGNLMQVYAEASAANGEQNPPSIPGLLYVRTSSTSESTFPAVWNASFNLDVTSIPNCPHGSPPQVDVRTPLIGIMPNGDQDVWIRAECYPFSATSWYFHHDHTQAYTAGWTGPTQFTAIPPGYTAVNWGCIQDSGAMNTDPADGNPVFVLGGVNASSGSTCTNSAPWLIKTTDNGVTWSIVRCLFGCAALPTFEVSLVNTSGNTWIAFLREVSTAPTGTFYPLYFSTSTDDMVTWTGWQSSTIPATKVCQKISPPEATKTEYAVSPIAKCGNTPASGLCVLFYTDRVSCNAAGFGSEMAVQFDPSQVLSNGATYLGSLVPTSLRDGVISSSIDGYPYIDFPSSTTFHLWWHGVNTIYGNNQLAIFQAYGTFSNITSTITIIGGGAFNGTVTTSDGVIICNITNGNATGACTDTVIDGTMITMTATVGRRSSFGGFSGWCGGTGSPSTCTVNTNQNVIATFNALIPDVIMGGKQNSGGTVVSQ